MTDWQTDRLTDWQTFAYLELLSQLKSKNNNVIGNCGVDCKEKLNIDFSGAVKLILEEIIGNQEEENEEEELDYNSDSDM